MARGIILLVAICVWIESKQGIGDEYPRPVLRYLGATSELPCLEYSASLYQKRPGDTAWEKGLSGTFRIDRNHGWKHGDIVLDLPAEMSGLRLLAAFDGEKDFVKEVSSGRTGVTYEQDRMTRRFVDLGVTMGDDLGPYFSTAMYAPLKVLIAEKKVEIPEVGEDSFLVRSKERGPGLPYYELNVNLHESGIPEALQLTLIQGDKRNVTRLMEVEQFGEAAGCTLPIVYTLSYGSSGAAGRFELDLETVRAVPEPTREMFRLDTTNGEWAHFKNAP